MSAVVEYSSWVSHSILTLQSVQKFKKMAEEYGKRVEELLQEREFNKNQLLYLREELAKSWAEREAYKSHGRGDAQLVSIPSIIILIPINHFKIYIRRVSIVLNNWKESLIYISVLCFPIIHLSTKLFKP